MTIWLDALTVLIGLAALAYALKRLLPAMLWARLLGRTPAKPASGCAGGCDGCASARKAD